MSISLKTHKMLWGRASARCAFPECRISLVEDATDTDDPALIGEECHIVASSPLGPRGEEPLASDQRDKYANLILLCRNHHKIVDDQRGKYSREILIEMKLNHELWVESNSAGFDKERQRDDEIYASYVDEWAKRIDLDDWQSWASWLISGGGPKLKIEHDDQLHNLIDWVASRIWPGRYVDLENSFQNLCCVLGDLLLVFHLHSDDRPNSVWYNTTKSYKTERWDQETYQRVLNEYESHTALVADLTLELTRAANLICDYVRAHLMHSFRLKQGALLVGPIVTFESDILRNRPEYRREERIARPYPGLDKFMTEREGRTYCFDRGGHNPLRP
jgi:hypothetical protein